MALVAVNMLIVRNIAKAANLNFSQRRGLRKLIRSFEPISEIQHLDGGTPRIRTNEQKLTRNLPVPAVAENPFRTASSKDVNTWESQPTNEDLSRIEEIASTSSFNPLPATITKKPDHEKLPSPFDPIDPESPPDLVSNFAPTFNLAAYVNQSDSLQQLIKLGVDLSRIEKRKGLAEFILKFDFEKDMKQYLSFLTDLGVPASELGEFLTKNPLIFKVDLGDLEVRVNYLEMKKFNSEQIARIVTKNPFWLMFPTKRIDRRLGHFQKNFHLSGNDIRFLTTKQPRLITYNMEHIRKTTFCVREEMGFNEEEVKCLLLSKPRLWMMASDEVIERFDFVHRVMHIPQSQIIQFPEVLTCRLFRLKERHGFLKYLGKAQYDASKELYVSLKRMIEGSDKEFVIEIAKSTMDAYNTYLRTL